MASTDVCGNGGDNGDSYKLPCPTDEEMMEN
jgi:hypothetical protein